MEGILRVTPAELISISNDLSAKGNAISSLTAEMTNQGSSLTSAWEGEAATVRGIPSIPAAWTILKSLSAIRSKSDEIQNPVTLFAQSKRSFESLHARLTF